MSNVHLPAVGSYSAENLVEGELGLLDVVDFIRQHYKFIGLAGLCAMLIGGAYSLIAPSKYQAIASVQPAKVLNVDVEPANLLVAKLKLPNYYSAGTIIACDLSNARNPGQSLVTTLQPVLDKTAPIVSLVFKSTSADKAKECLTSVIKDISAEQSFIADPAIRIKRAQLALAKENLESAEKVVKIFDQKKLNFDFNDSKLSISSLLLATTLSKANEIREMRAQVVELQIVLAEPQTRPTSLVTPIYAPSVPVGPTPVQIALISLLIGAVLSTGYLLGKKLWVNNHRN